MIFVGALLLSIAIAYCIFMLYAPNEVPAPIEPVLERPKEPEFDRLAKFGEYYNHFNVGGRYGMTFEQFIIKVRNGTWEEMVNNGPIWEVPVNDKV